MQPDFMAAGGAAVIGTQEPVQPVPAAAQAETLDHRFEILGLTSVGAVESSEGEVAVFTEEKRNRAVIEKIQTGTTLTIR